MIKKFYVWLLKAAVSTFVGMLSTVFLLWVLLKLDEKGEQK